LPSDPLPLELHNASPPEHWSSLFSLWQILFLKMS
jgi:hypothetical protein